MAFAAVGLALTAVAVDAATTPSAPRNLKATAGDQQVTLSWSAPSSGAPITGYVITSTPVTQRISTPETTYKFSGLKNGTTYLFAVRAYNVSGLGTVAWVSATPHATPPGPPTGLAATPGPGDGQYTFSWNPPTTTGSSPDGNPPTIDHYTVKISPNAACQSLSPTSCIASNIPDNLSSAFSVTATNSRNVTGPAATVYAPLPTGANIGLAPTAGVSTTNIAATGQLFLANENITLYWDTPTHVAASVVTDANGSFAKTVKPFAGDKPQVHKLCASVQPKPCANFTLRPPPTPTVAVTPSPDESPSPAGSPQASGPRTGQQTGGGLSGLDIITRPPFVFLPIIAILGLLGVLAFWALSGRRRPPAPAAATVVHRATRPDYTTPFPPPRTPGAPVTPSGAQPPIPAQPPAQPAWQAPVSPAPQPPAPLRPPPVQPPPPAAAPPAPPAAPQAPPPAAPPGPVEWPAPPPWAATPDEPPDLPQPSD